jgi:hypothetical protein
LLYDKYVTNPLGLVNAQLCTQTVGRVQSSLSRDHDSMLSNFAGCVVVAGPGGCHGDTLDGWSMVFAHVKVSVLLPRMEFDE